MQKQNKTPEIDSGLISRNISVQGHRTSVRLEPEMWFALKDITRRENCTLHALCSLVSIRKRPQSSLTAAIRVFVMLYYRAATTEEGHKLAGHGALHLKVERAGIFMPERRSVMTAKAYDQQVAAAI